ncbi:MAG: ABC transporter ATP-binding protein [Geminicoccaceae bacterium]|nr:ABC transporter ATP-binding protein [Geminicoccaceae bacterium]
MTASQSLDVSGIVRAFGPARALDDFSLSVAPGEFVSILGPSGCGKSTLLRVVAGLEDADAGTIRIGDRSVRGLRPKDRQIAFVFQSYALYPHMTCRQNLAAPLVMRELSPFGRNRLVGRLVPGSGAVRRAIAERVERTAALLGIEALLDRRPSQLSGGQRQRVALGRALIREPRLFLLDEPLANLDAALRNRTRGELHDLQRRLGTTTLFVTHDQAEAMAISDRVVVMFAGRVRQIGTPDDLYRNPVDLDVARFLSQPHLNAVGAALIANTLPSLRVRGTPVARAGGVVAFRPEHARVMEAGRGLPFTVRRAEHAGSDAHLFVALRDGTRCVARIPSETIADWPRGRHGILAFDPEAAWIFPAPEGDAGHAPHLSVVA